MYKPRSRVPQIALTSLAGLLIAGCGGSSGKAANPAASIKVPAGAFGQKGQIRYCSDISSPPLEFYVGGQYPTGSDVEIGNAIAAQLGVRPVWLNTAFAGIIPALQAGHCDAIISQLFDKPARRGVVDFVDYMNSGEALLVRKGNPSHITGLDSLCGLAVAAETGTTVSDFLTKQSKTCASQGKKRISIQTFLRDTDAINQLSLGRVATYGTTTATGAYDMSKNPDMYEIAGPPFGQIPTGIATTRRNKDLHKGIAAAFAVLQKNGTYEKIMTKYNLKTSMLPTGQG
jgi:polar amino acid transport system substrate-binding protein